VNRQGRRKGKNPHLRLANALNILSRSSLYKHVQGRGILCFLVEWIHGWNSLKSGVLINSLSFQYIDFSVLVFNWERMVKGLSPFILGAWLWVAMAMPVQSQNLVPNPDFEIFIFCPPSNLGGLEGPPWTSPLGSSDYFHACSDPMYRGVPINFQGHQAANSGDAYMGMYTMTFNSNSREFIQAPLLDTLIEDHCYKASAWINLIDEGCGADQFGILLTETSAEAMLGASPQVGWGGDIISDSINWTKILGYFIASGTEQYITLGNFKYDNQTNMDQSCYGPLGYAYYYADDILVEELPIQQIQVDLGASVVACDSFVIDPGGDMDIVYNWSTGHQGMTLTVYTSGTYSVTASYACTTEEAEIEVTILHPVQVDIGPPAALICIGEEYEITLDPYAGDYVWDDGSTDSEYVITAAGLYAVTLDDGCQLSSDTVVVTTMDEPLPFSLGVDTFLCPGGVFTISLDPGLGDFEWQDNSNDPFYTIDDEGTYALTISNMCGEQTDEIEVISLQYPFVFLGPDTISLCSGQEIEFDLDPDQGTYVWQDGSTSALYSVSAGGVYSVTVTNVCGTDNTQIFVDEASIPDFDFGADIQACPGDTIILNPGSQNGDYTWQDGSAGSVFEVSASGIYSLGISNNCGDDSDTVIVTYTPVITAPSLGPDIDICPGDQVILSVPVSGGNIVWNDMSTTDTLLVTVGGTYSVQVSSVCEFYSDTIIIALNSNPPVVQLLPDFDLCQGDTVTIDAGLSGVSYLWNDGSINSLLDVTAPGIYSITVSNACGTSVDSVVIGAGEMAPFVFLGADTSLCTGDTILISPVFDHVDTWIWHDGSAAPQLVVTAAGIVHIAVSNTCGNAYDTLMIGLLPAVPPLDLGADTAVCPGESVLLAIAIPDVSILWSDGSTGNNITVSDSAIFFATISNVCGSATDSVSLSLLPQTPPLDLGPDQTICPGEVITLSPGIAGVSYVWHDGSTAPEYQATQEETIYLAITNVCGTSTDTLVLTESTDGPQIDLGPDVFACVGDSIILDAGISGVQYVWQDGSVANTYVATLPGVYSLTVTNSCGTDVDSVEVEYTSPPLAQDLGPDTTVCEGEELLLSANASIGIQLTWQDQASGTTFLVTEPGSYSISAVNQCGSAHDTVEISFLQGPDAFSLGPDTTICPGASVLLSAPSSFFDVLWHDGSGMLQFLANHSGTYWLRLSNECGTTSDTIRIDVDSRTPLVTLEPEYLWCPGDQFTLDAGQLFDATYLWSTGAMTSSIHVDEPGIYTVDVFTPCYQDSGQSEIHLDDDCPTGPVFYIPNVFSPNGDGINDVFMVSTNFPNRVLYMEGIIYDRWGNVVYSSEGIDFSWDGSFAHETVNPAVFCYRIMVTFESVEGNRTKFYNGDISVIR